MFPAALCSHLTFVRTPQKSKLFRYMAGRSAALSSVRIHSTTAPSLVLIIPDGRARFEAALDQARHFRAMSDCDALPADKSTLRAALIASIVIVMPPFPSAAR
mmetsp:Transcript_9861/g.15813  ORF Transcript_9861/g.15813 Transcript_9861/m.15813 type:complete len:103 (+) Transcript_9861:447-755(+)